jgi:hypothetical protein
MELGRHHQLIPKASGVAMNRVREYHPRPERDRRQIDST